MSLLLSLLMLFSLMCIAKKKKTLPNWKSAVLSSPVMSRCCSACHKWWCIWQTVTASVSHVCNMSFMHITHQLIELSCTQLYTGSGIKDFQPLNPNQFLCYCIFFFSSYMLNVSPIHSYMLETLPIWGASVWTDTQQHVPTVLHFGRLLWHEIFICKTHCIDMWNTSLDNKMKWGQSAAFAVCEVNRPHSLTTCSRLEMFTLNIWFVFQLSLCAIFVLTVFLVIFCPIYFFLFFWVHL